MLSSDPVSNFVALASGAFLMRVFTMKTKAADLQEQVQKVNSNKLVTDFIDSSKGLVDNFLGGNLLNSGDLYGDSFQNSVLPLPVQETGIHGLHNRPGHLLDDDPGRRRHLG